MTRPIDLKGATVIITGGGGGLGRSHAIEFARRGAKIVVNDLPGTATAPSAADRVVDDIREFGGEAVASYDTVADAAGGQAIVDCAVEHFGTVDVVINNAGNFRPGKFADLSAYDIEEVLRVHVLGTFFVTQPAWRIMQETGYGRIVMTASSSGSLGVPGASNYSAAKASLLGLTHTLAIEGEQFGIRVNAVLPVADRVQTDGRPALAPSPELDRLVAARAPLSAAERLTAEWVTPMVLLLSSRQCPVNGECLSVIAGVHARSFVTLTAGWISEDTPTPEQILAHWDQVEDRNESHAPKDATAEIEVVAERVSALLSRA